MPREEFQQQVLDRLRSIEHRLDTLAKNDARQDGDLSSMRETWLPVGAVLGTAGFIWTVVSAFLQ